jgi:MFS family permease
MTSTTTAPDTASRWGLVALLVSGMTFCYAQRGTLSVAAPFMIRDLHINTETMGLMLSAFSWCYCFMQVPSGWIVDRFGVRRAYAWGFAIWSIACALTGATRNIAAIIGFRITVGVGQSVAFPASARVVANWFPDRERGTVNSSYLIGVRLGQALANAAGVGLIALYGWRMLFVIAGLLPLVWILPWMWWLRRFEDPRSASAGSVGPSSRFSFASSFGLLRHRSVLGTFLDSLRSTTSGSSSSTGCRGICGSSASSPMPRWRSTGRCRFS